jgi:hypothetical protein
VPPGSVPRAWAAPGRRAFALVVLVTGAGIVAAGTPARGAVADTSEMLTRVVANVDPGTLPAISVATEVTDFDTSSRDRGCSRSS